MQINHKPSGHYEYNIGNGISSGVAWWRITEGAGTWCHLEARRKKNPGQKNWKWLGGGDGCKQLLLPGSNRIATSIRRECQTVTSHKWRLVMQSVRGNELPVIR